MTEEAEETRSIWRNGPFARLWAAQAISQTAQNAIWYALLVLVEEQSHSTTHLGITILSVILPSILFGVPAGVYVDRWDKRMVLIVTNLARVAIVASFVLFPSLLALVYAIAFVFSVVSQFFGPAELAMIPAVVGRRRLMQATSLFHLTFTASQLVGLILLGPLLVKLLGTEPFFLFSAGLYLICAILVWALPAQPPDTVAAGERHPLQEMWRDLTEVTRLLNDDRIMLWSMAYWTLGVGLTLMVAMLSPRFVVDVLGIAAKDTVYIVGPGVAGTLLAAVLLSRGAPGNWTSRHALILRGLVVVGVSLALVGAAPLLARVFGLLRPEGVPVDVLTQWDLLVMGAIMVATFFGGVGFTAVMIGSQTSLQERAPADARGRVFAVQLMLGNLCSVVPLLSFGAVSDMVGVRWIMPITGVLVLGVAIIGRRRAPTEPLATG